MSQISWDTGERGIPRSPPDGERSEVGRRGCGDRESGVFLLADQTGDRRTVIRVVYLTTLTHCLTGGIQFDGRAYSLL